jgi:hypothetical protein
LGGKSYAISKEHIGEIKEKSISINKVRDLLGKNPPTKKSEIWHGGLIHKEIKTPIGESYKRLEVEDKLLQEVTQMKILA